MGDRGQYVGDERSKMAATAIDIAVSEMTGLPAEQICGYIIITVAHTERAGRGHEVSIMPSREDWPWVARWLKRVLADVRSFG